MIHIVADQYIPLLAQLCTLPLRLTQLPSTQIDNAALQHADILLCRSVTPINAKLLQDTPIRFVATATSGYDHLDVPWLTAQGIHWGYAPGCNAIAVAEYVVCCIAQLRNQGLLTQDKLRAGVIGIGQVGQQVVHALTSLDFEVLQNDPLRAAQDACFHSTPLTALTDLDLICIHTPLTKTGEHPTHHLIDQTFLSQQKPGCVLLNAGRGAVINSDDLLRYGKHLVWCLDVFANEPTPDPKIIDTARIATPHIAGHTIQAKWRGAESVYQQAMYFLQLPHQASPKYPTGTLKQTTTRWEDQVLSVYNPQHDSQQLKANPYAFSQLRNDYPVRHEFAYCKNVPSKN